MSDPSEGEPSTETLAAEESISTPAPLTNEETSAAEAVTVVEIQVTADASAASVSDAKPSAPIVSTNLPSKLIRVAVTDELERLRITASIGAFIEDIVEGDTLKSKHLTKLSAAYSNASSKGALLPSLSSIVEELLKVSIVTSGKQANSLAANVKQGVCTLLPEHAKDAKKHIQTLFNRITAIGEEIKRNKIAYARLVERQQRVVKEAEQALRVLNNNNEDISAVNNATFRKTMLSTLAGEKKGLERYRAMLRELDGIEHQMQSDCRRINVSRTELVLEISKAFKELEILEVERLQVMREGIDRLLLSYDVAIKTHIVAFAPSEDQLAKLNLRAEIDAFLSRSASSETVSLPAAFAQYDLEAEKSTYTSALRLVSLKADRMEEILDYFLSLSKRLGQCILDAGNAEQLYVQAAARAVEKHGFPRLPCEGSIFEQSRPPSETASLLKDELPTTRAQWESAVQLIGHVLDAHTRTIEFYNEESSNQFELIQSRIIVCKKTLVEKSSGVLRNMEVSLQEIGKVRTKLTRVRQQIREKKQLVRNIKGTPEAGAGVCVPVAEISAAEAQEMSSQDIGELSSSVSNMPTEPTTPSTPHTTTATATTATVNTGTTSGGAPSMSSFASAAVLSRRAMESFGSTLRATANLKQVVGLETSADRVSRVEAQIAQMEEEERQLMESEKHTINSFEALLNVVHTELEDVVSLAVEIFITDVDTLKNALSKYLTWHKEKFSPIVSLSKELREKIMRTANDVKDDYRVVYERLLARDNFFEAELFDIPSAEVFEAHKLVRFGDDADTENNNASDAAAGEGAEIEGAISAEDLDSVRQRAISGEDLGSPIKAEFELKKFGLSTSDRVLESHSCALYPKKGLLTHGRMFVTQHFIAFSGWPETRVLLRINTIEKVEKTNTLMYIPNAISLTTKDKEEYFFGSFIDRDQCHSLINRLLEVEKHILEVHGENEALASRKLEYGYQQVKVASPPPALSTKNGATPKDSEKQPSTATSVSTEEDTSESDKQRSDSSAEAVEVEEELNIFKEASANFSATFNSLNLIEMTNTRLDVTAKQVLKHCWINSADYESYLTNSGDFDVKKEEWKPTLSPAIPEDTAKLSFHFGRELFFQHPRTTMLMFGPKNAPTQQRQYLYVPFQATTDGSFTLENIAKSKIDKFCVLIITQFDGVPMADVFRVLLYQFYENIDGKCHIRYGLGMHYVKSTMFKGQIISGTKEELVTQLAAWVDHIKKTTARAIAAAGGKPVPTIAEPAAAGGEPVPAETGVVPAAAARAAHAEPNADILQQVLSAIMGNGALAVLVVLIVLFLLQHIWYTRSQISYLTKRVDELESWQKKILLEVIERSRSS